jgi:predicted NUDIX family NTP pyrophosphohydrolase
VADRRLIGARAWVVTVRPGVWFIPGRDAGSIHTRLPTPNRRRSSARRSAGILLHRRRDGKLQVLLVHPGGPVWAKRDLGAWSIPKGEYEPDEDPLEAARREFGEELGTRPPSGEAADLGEIRQKSGKVVHAWALAGDLDPNTVESNTFELEWPPRSRRLIEIPEVDRAEWFALDAAREKINPAQVELLDRLTERDT